MIDFLTFVYAYLCLTAFLIFVLLFGDAPWAQGTPLSFCRWLISEAWVDALEFAVSKAFGLAGIRVLDRVTECCCERSNPALQIGYLIIWSVGYGLYWQHVFQLLPNLYAEEYHMYAGTLAVCATLTTFLLASGTGPGKVTQQSAAKYLAAYPPDGLLFPPKACITCNLPRPGRSKHCGVCGGCIPRFDHHCGWVNTCVGLHNMRVFLLFLAANLATCVYALWLMVATMRGELHKRGFFDVWVYDPMTRQRAPLHQKPGRFVEFLVVRYPVQLALGMFIAVGGILMAAFLAYQVYLISTGTTTYEQFKRNAVYKELRQLAAAHAAVTAAHTSTSPMQPDPLLHVATATAAAAAAMQPGPQPHAGLTPPEDVLQQHDEQQQQEQQQHVSLSQPRSGSGSWLPWVRGSKGGAGRVVCRKRPPPYDRGFKQNWLEVLFPELFLQQEQQRQQQQQGLRGHVAEQRGRQQQRGGKEGSVAQQQQQHPGTAGMQTGPVSCERKQQ